MNLYRTARLSAAALTLGCLLSANGPHAVAGDKDVILSKVDALLKKDNTDTKLKDSFHKVYTVKLTEDQAVRIDLSSKDFRTLVRLEDAKGKELHLNYSVDKKNLDSRILFLPAKSGEYRVIATTIEGGKTGLFTIEVVKATAAEANEARLLRQVDRYASLSEQERKQVVAELTKKFQDTRGKLTFPDAELAIQLYFASEDVSIKHAKEICDAMTQIFKAADDEDIASVTGYLEKSFKRTLKFVGKELPIAGKTVDGKSFDLKKLRGKVVLVDFWATWCGPCIAEIPNMLEAHAKYGKRGFEVIGVSLDRDDDDIVKFNEKRNIPWKSINIEDSRKLADEYDVNSIPFAVLIDRNGNVVSVRARGAQLDRLLDRLLPDEKK